MTQLNTIASLSSVKINQFNIVSNVLKIKKYLVMQTERKINFTGVGYVMLFKNTK